MTRKKVLALLMASAVTFGSALPMATSIMAMPENQYSDVEKSDTFFEYVEDVTDYKIMEGLEDKADEFGVAEKITRGDLVEYLYKMMLEPTANGSLKFEDALNQDYEEAVVWADSVGLFEGLDEDFFKDDKFAADTEVTREQAAVILNNLAVKVLKIDFESEDEEDIIKDKDGNVLKALENLDEYEDGKEVDEDYLEAVKWAVGYTLLNPATEDTEDDRYDEEIAGKLHMQDTIEKVDLAEAISKLLDMVPKDSDVETAKTEYEEKEEAASQGSGTVSTGGGYTPVVPVQRPVQTSAPEASVETPSVETPDDETPAPTPSPEAPHEHTWEKNEWSEEGHFEKELVKDAWTETIEHPEEGHTESVMVSPEESHLEEVVLEAEEGHREDIYHEEEGHYEEVVVEPEEGHFENVLVSEEEGHYENVMVSPEEGHYETVHHEEQGHYEDQEVSPEKGHFETVHHEAVYETVHHEAVYETVHHEEEGHYENVQVGTEPVYEAHRCVVCNLCGAIMYDYAETPYDEAAFEEAVLSHEAFHGSSISYKTTTVNVQVGENPIYEEQWVVDTPAYDEQVLVSEAWDEQVLVSEAYDEQVWVVDQEAVYDKVWVVDQEAYDEQVWVVDKEAQYEEQWVVDKEAVYEEQWVVDKPAVTEQQWVVDKEAYTEAVWVVDKPQKSDWVTVVDKEAVYEEQWVVDKEAWTETIEHPAEYKDVWVVDKEAGFNWVCSGCGEVKEEEI